MVALSAAAPQGIPRQIWNIGGALIRPSSIRLRARRMAQVEDFEFGFDAGIQRKLRHAAQVVCRVDVSTIATAVHAATIETANVRLAFEHERKTRLRADHVAALPGQ
jgi:hypothetical protein